MTSGFFGEYGLSSDTGELELLHFIISTYLAQWVRTGVPVVVKKVTGGGNTVGKAPTVDVQPIINQVDGQGNQTAHGIVLGLPVLRAQGGKNAIIVTPEVGDIGFVVMADRDISAAKANNGKVSNPGSKRRFNLADGVYIGAILNPANPTQYVQFRTDGIKLADKNGNTIVMSSAGINLNGVIIDSGGNIKVPGNALVNGGVTAGVGGADSVTLQHHVHPAPGFGVPPTPGT